MKKTFLAASAAALLISTASAFAADLPSRKEAPVYVPPPPPPLWTGFYVGLNAGGAFGGGNSLQAYGGPVWGKPWVACGGAGVSSRSARVPNANLPGTNGGFIGGGQIGYNYQWGQNFVVGLETDIQGFAGGGGGDDAVTAASYVPAGDTPDWRDFRPTAASTISARCAAESAIS